MKKTLISAGVALTVLALPLVTSASSSGVPTWERAAQPVVEPVKEFGKAPLSAMDHPTQTDSLPRPEGVAGGYVYVPVTPFRTFDSRMYMDGWMWGGETIWFSALTDTNDVPKIPANAVAITYNLAVADTFGSGFVGIFPANVTWPGNASINWTYTGTILSNGGTVGLGAYTQPGQIALYVGPRMPGYGTLDFDRGTDFVIDITGYYA